MRDMSDKEKKQKEPKPPSNIAKYGIIRRRRSGVLLTKEEVREIKSERKKLRSELRALGEKDRKEFELTASSLGLYFDDTKAAALFKWFVHSKFGWILLISAGVLFLALYAISLITQMRGLFTINMSKDLFREGFAICEDEEFKTPTSRLFSTPATEVPCISIVDIAENVDEGGGEKNGNYFAYSFYMRNEGETAADYQWELRLSAESMSLSKTAWVMIFVDGEMTVYAKANENGEPEALPERGNDSVGYLIRPLYDYAADKSQYELIKEHNTLSYWRIVPKPFLSDDLVAAGEQLDVEPGEVHKYTIVVWLEGDDPDCTSEVIGGHLGFEMFMAMIDED